ncbi:2480_t:CDS:2 [Funneliformis geosporum]|uniref:2480_t:CDS:1 n=1 Tax=Funneliformis geosporum TaxID=1117311 RepID=A0A9W4WR85_9GLOM|nr:2480_t:CDS:2 [Funneliformis geosporum]
MSNHRLLTVEEWNKKLSSNKHSFPIDPAIKEILFESNEDHAKWSLNRELLQTLKSSLEKITKFDKDSDIKEFLSKFNNLIRLPHVQTSKDGLSSNVQMFSELIDETLPKHLENWDDSIIEILFSIFSQILLLLLVTKHSESIMDHLEEVKVAAEKSTAFMKKSVLER